MLETLLFPFYREHIPFVKYFNVLQDHYHISHLCSFSGTGYNGHDYMYAENKNSKDKLFVEEFSPSFAEESDALILLPICQDNIEGTLEECEKIKKYFYDNRCQILDTHKAKNKITNSYREHIEQQVWELKTPVLFVCGTVSDANQTEVALCLVHRLQLLGIKAKTITNSNCYSLLKCSTYSDSISSITDTNRLIIQLNHLAKDIEDKESPDLLVVDIPESVMRYNNNIVGNFGIRTYIFSQAIPPSLCICCSTCENFPSEYYRQLADTIKARFGMTVAAFHISNHSINRLLTDNQSCISYNYFDEEHQANVIEQINVQSQIIPLYNLTNFDQMDSFIQGTLLNYFERL